MQVSKTVLPPSVVVAGGVVYACQGSIFALDAASGNVWARNEVRGVSGLAATPDALYATCNYVHEHYVAALQATDGATIWRYDADGRLAHGSPPALGADHVYVSVEGDVLALRIVDSSLAWRTHVGGF